MRDTFSQLVRLGAIIVLVALALFWVDSTFFAPGRITCNQEELDADPARQGHICYDKLRADWGDRIIWIDARSQSDFEVNQLSFNDGNPKARMFPIRNDDGMQTLIRAAMARLLEASENGECIVVFCSSEDCGNADAVAKTLRDIEILDDVPVFVLEGGWATLLNVGMVKR